METLDTPLSGLPLPYVNQAGTTILETRVKDVDGMRSLWQKLHDADLKSNAEMAKVQAMADGEAPFSIEQRRASGQAYLSNFNPNDFKALLDTSLAAYTDLVSADETLIEVFTTYGEPSERDQWSQIMSRNMSRNIRSWPRFFFQFAFIPHYFTLHGVGISYFEDCYNWQWSVSNLGLVKIPRDTLACEDEIPYAFARSRTSPQTLLKYVKDERTEKLSAEEGWNIPALKKALMQVNTAGDTNSTTTDWTAFTQYWKNNDISWGENSPQVSLIYGWIKENDGTISVYIFTENALDNRNGEKEEFLCCKRHAYNTAQEAFIFFTRGIGTNGTYHSIRGLGADIYNAMQALMRLENRKFDIAFESGPVWQVASEEDIESQNMTPWGAGMLVTRGVNPLNITTPLMSNTIEPAIQSLRSTIQQNVGTYTSANALQGQREMTKAETLARLEQTATLSVTSINLFNQPMDRLAREIARRFTRKGYQRSDPGGHYVHDWIQDCIAEGVPPEALHQINHRRTRAARVIGFGSPAARRVALQLMMELYQEMDDYAKARLLNKVAGATVGFEEGNLYFPLDKERVAMDAQIAELQNDALASGGQVSVSPSENKRVHLEVHIGKMGEYIGQFREAGENPALYAEIVPPLDAIYEHAAQTLEGYTGQDAPLFKQLMQQAGEILVNGTRHLQKEQERQMQEGGEMMGGDGQQPDPEAMARQQELNDDMERRVIEFQVKLKELQADRAAKRAEMMMDAQAKRTREDLLTAAKISRETAAAQFQKASNA